MDETIRKISTWLAWAIVISTVGFFLRLRYDNLIREVRPLTVEQIPAIFASPLEYGFSIKELSPDGARVLKEFAKFAAPQRGISVVRISEDPRRDNMLAIYKNGAFRKWNVSSGDVVKEYDFLAADFGNTFFNADGSYLISTGAIVWDTKNGNIVSCRTNIENCATPDTIAEHIGGIYIDPIRPIDVSYESFFGIDWTSFDETFKSSMGLTNGALSCWDYVRDYDMREGGPEWGAPSTYRIAIDPSGRYVACYIISGVVIVRDWSRSFDRYEDEDGINRLREYPYLRIRRYTFLNKNRNPKDMSFDSTRTWLSVLTDHELVVWDLRRWFFAHKLNVPVSDGNAIAFDRSGKMLALGTKRGITIYDVGKGKQIAEFNVGEVTALYFTRDNRLLVWGDAEGNIHLWGIPKDE